MATEEVIYVSYVEAVLLHIELMRLLGEIRYGVFDRALVESALARPKQTRSKADKNLEDYSPTELKTLFTRSG